MVNRTGAPERFARAIEGNTLGFDYSAIRVMFQAGG